MPYTHDPDASGVAPEGTYEVTVTEIKETTSSKGDAMWIVRLEDDAGHEITEFVVHKPNIISWKFEPLWTASGLAWPEGKAVIDEQQLVGRSVLLTVRHEKSKDFGLQARIEGVAPLRTGQLDDGAGQFETTPAGKPDPDDDIPF